MSRKMKTLTSMACIVAAMALVGCSSKADVSRSELAEVVERDGVAYAPETIPDELVDLLAGNQVIVLGETHHLREHWEFVASLLQELYARGFRQLLFEAPHMADWLFDDYVTDGQLAPDWKPTPFYARRLDAIRQFNLSLAPDDRIHVRAIDVNEDNYGGAAGFRSLLAEVATHLPATEEIDAVLQGDFRTQAGETEAIESFQSFLDGNRAALSESWGTNWYERVLEMTRVERSSIDIRAYRKSDDNHAARAREEAIKEIADLRLSELPGGTVINVGAHHAQKARLMGTNQEWLGDYLVHRSDAAGRNVIVLGISAAQIELEPGADGSPFSVLDASPDNEILRLMAETWPGQNVFLPLDDPLFSNRTIAYASEETTYVTALRNQFDVIVQYGLAHRMPID
jgi:erythromycin esterase-like protein